MIVPKSAVDDVQQLVDMVRQVNANEVKPEDQLSNNIYEYDSETHTLKIAGNEQTQSEASNTGGLGDSNTEDKETLSTVEDHDGPKITM